MTTIHDDLPEFFFQRYGYAWEFRTGERAFDAIVRIGEGFEVRAPAHLVVGPDGQPWVVIRPAGRCNELVTAATARPLVEFSVESDDGVRITIPRLCIEQYDLQAGPGSLYQRPTGNLVCILHGQPRETFSAIVIEEAVVTHGELRPDSEYTVRFMLTNTIYAGLEIVGDDVRRERSRMVFNAGGRRWTLDYLPEFERRREAVSNGHLAHVPTASLAAEGVLGRDLVAMTEQVDSICWLISIASGCGASDPIRQVLSGTDLIQERYAPRMAPTDGRSYRNFELIANHVGGASLRELLEQTFDRFTALRTSLELPQFIGWMLQASAQSVLETRILTSILALEAITTRWCLTEDPDRLTQQQVLGMSVQQKLNRMRRFGMNFIDTDFTDDLRGDVRNPLFHTGAIPFLTPREKNEWAINLYMLGFKIFLKLLGFRGKHRDMAQDYRVVDAP